VPAIVPGVGPQNRLQVGLVIDEHPVGALGPYGPYPAFGIAARPGRPRQGLHHADSPRTHSTPANCVPQTEVVPTSAQPRLHAHLREVKERAVLVRRITVPKRMRAKLKEVKDQLRRRMHQPVPAQGRWLASVLRGHMAYYAVPGNAKAIRAFCGQVTRHWHKALRRRSQKTRINADAPDPTPAATAPSRDASLPGGALRRYSPKVGATGVRL